MTYDRDATVTEMLAGLERILAAIDRTSSPDLATWDTPLNHGLRQFADDLLSAVFPHLDPAGVIDEWFERGAHLGDLGTVAREMHAPADEMAA